MPNFSGRTTKLTRSVTELWRPIIGEVIRKFLTCGDPHFGFARIRCPDCRHEMFVPFSCRQRSVCPSCHQKRTLLCADTIANSICEAVPHRQLVFTIPKRLRLHFRFDRSLLGDLARAGWETVVEVYRSELGHDDVLPGMIAGIQTFGQLV
jgi:ribosomal protein S27E